MKNIWHVAGVWHNLIGWCVMSLMNLRKQRFKEWHKSWQAPLVRRWDKQPRRRRKQCPERHSFYRQLGAIYKSWFIADKSVFETKKNQPDFGFLHFQDFRVMFDSPPDKFCFCLERPHNNLQLPSSQPTTHHRRCAHHKGLCQVTINRQNNHRIGRMVYNQTEFMQKLFTKLVTMKPWMAPKMLFLCALRP